MNFLKKIIKTQEGLSLIEVTIGAAMAIGVALMVMKTGQVSQKTLKKAQSDTELTGVKDFFRSTFANSANCTNTFAGEGRDYLDTTIAELQAHVGNPAPGIPAASMPSYYRYSEVAPDINQITIETTGAPVVVQIGEDANPIPGFPEWTLTEFRIYQIYDTDADSEGLCPLYFEFRRNVGASSKRSYGAERVNHWSVLNCRVAGTPALMASCIENKAVIPGFWELRNSSDPAQGIIYNGGVSTANVEIAGGGSIILQDGGYVSISSDERIKKEIIPIENSSDKINELNGFYYFFRQEEFPYRNFPEERQVGVIAQEVERILPEAVQTTRDGTKTVNYSMLIPVLIEAHKEQDIKIKELERKIDKLLEKKK